MNDNKKIKISICEMFDSLEEKANEITDIYSNDLQLATEKISDLVVTTVSVKARNYIVDIYTYLVDEIKQDAYFKDEGHLNAFYRLNLRKEMNEKYQFNIESMLEGKNKINFEEINRIYAATGATVGSLTLGGILKLVMLETINIPIAVIIAGSVCAGVTTYFKVSDKNEKGYRLAVKKYLDDMEKEVLDWLDEVERYFRSRVASLKK